MAFLQVSDLPDDNYEALFAARERRMEILKELRTRIEEEGPRRLSRVPEELVREDRER